MRVNKTGLARELGVTKARITHYTERGMPFGDDGRIELEEARTWLDANLDPIKRAMRGRAPAPPARAAAPSSAPPPQADVVYAATAEAAIIMLPVLVVIFAAARLGLSREQATDLAEHVMLGMWEQLDGFGRENDLLPSGGELAIASAVSLSWRDRVNWAEIFDAEGNGKIDRGDV